MSVVRVEVGATGKAWEDVFALLDQHWSRLSEYVALAASWGGDWRAMSTPVCVWEDGELVAHAGVWALPSFVLDGKTSVVRGIHAVCTRADARRRGHAKRALAQALALADETASRQLLFAVDPRVYESSGFRRVGARRFELDLPQLTPAGDGLRRLDLDDSGQRRRLLDLCGRRVPLSKRLSVVDGGPLLIVDEVLGTGGRGGRLWWLDDETVVAGELLGRELHLYDLITTHLRPLSEYALAWPGRFRRIMVYFDPQGLELGPWASHAPEGLRPRRMPFGDVPMVRGTPWPDETSFALSPLAHC